MKIEIELTDEILEAIADKVANRSIPQEPKEKIYTTEEVAELLGTTKQTITKHIRLGLLKAKKPGKHYLIPESNLKDYIHAK